MRRAIATRPLLTIALVALGVGVGFEFLRGLTDLGGRSLDGLTETWVYTVTEWLAIAVCLARVIRCHEDRLAWGLMAAGLAAWAGGDLVWTLWLDNVANPPFPSVADVLYLSMYPLIYGSLMLLIRSRLRDAGAAQWLDGGVVGLTIAGVAAALVFSDVLATGHGRLVAELVTAAYPVGDFALLAFVAVACSLANWRPGRLWLLLGLGISCCAVADIVYVDEVSRGTYQNGTMLNATWLLSISLLATAAWTRDRRPRRAHPGELPHTIIVTVLAAGAALALLVLAAFEPITPLAVALLAGALVVACLRAGLTYRENVVMMRRVASESLTDSLSGLGNRKALMVELEHAFSDTSGERLATLVFFDLNGFKRYNDTFGHAAGDALLARIGASLLASIDGRGRAYRLGGDEFCALLPGRHAAEGRLIAGLAGALVERGPLFTVDASFGLTVIPDDAATASAALQLADERMYASKARNNRAQARDVLMQVLSERAPGLFDHASVVTDLVRSVAEDLGLEAEPLDEALRAAELHDIGKLAVPDEILHKPGPLTATEWAFMRQHPMIGERILSAASALAPVAKLVRSSHERWDGTGYPDGLAGEAIPIGARIVFVCDAYEAITSDRCYQRARSPAEAIVELRRCAGTQFDPTVVEALARNVGRSGALATQGPVGLAPSGAAVGSQHPEERLPQLPA